MANTQTDVKEYVEKVLALYCNTPGTIGRVRREDRRLVNDLHRRGITLDMIEQSMVLAAARRSFRSPDAPPLSPIRSIHYFVPVIEEISVNPLSNDYFMYLKRKIAKLRRDLNNAAAEKQRPALKPP
jgi:hypothetical protein